MKVHIIGGVNLGVSIALGLSKFASENQITITRRNTSSILYLEKIKQQFPVIIHQIQELTF
jgi:pyrroline-5-carboxylate reductase